jgi:hypothetical protein
MRDIQAVIGFRLALDADEAALLEAGLEMLGRFSAFLDQTTAEPPGSFGSWEKASNAAALVRATLEAAGLLVGGER